MTTIPRASAELLLEGHLGVSKKTPEGLCITDYFTGLPRDVDCSTILDATMPSEPGTHNESEGHLFVYRECGRTACKRECGMVINAAGKILDAAPFSAACTGKIQ